MRSVTSLLLLVAVSGAILLGAGAWGVWRTLRDADQRAADDARQRCEVSAQALAQALRSPAALESADADQAFEISAGGFVVPELLGSVEPLDQAGDRAMEEDVQEAFAVARKEGSAERDRQLDALIASLFDVWTEGVAPDLSAGVLLLAAQTGRTDLPEGCLQSVARLSAELASGLFAALSELSTDAGRELAGSVRAIAASAQRQREAIRAAAAEIDLLAAASEPVVRSAGSAALLVYVPRAVGEGVGACVVPEEFVPRLVAAGGLGPVPLVGTLSRAADAVPVVDGLFGLQPPAVPTPSGWSGPTSLALIFAALSLLFVGGLFAIGRVFRAETAAVRARSEFLQSVTHELKTPLASIRLLAERLETGRVPADRSADYYGMLADESQRLTVLIDNVLDLGRIERGERAYDRRVQSARAIVDDAVDVFEPLARRDGIELCVEGEIGDAACEVDRGALMQSLLNVLDNARKYAKDGARILLRLSVADGMMQIDVRDFGPGIDAEERAGLFERFARGAKHRHGSIAGVGLGLHLARHILDAHGGSLECVEPAEGPGAVFRFALPLASEAVDDESVAS